MKRILSDSPVKGYQLFRFEKKKADGSAVMLPNFYIRHGDKTTCTGTDRLQDAKAMIKKQAGLDVRDRRRSRITQDEVTVGALLDLLVDDYKANGHRTIKNAQGQIKHSLRPYFGDMLAAKLDSDAFQKWISWRQSLRLRKSVRGGHTKLQPSSINREISLLRRAYRSHQPANESSHHESNRLGGVVRAYRRLGHANLRMARHELLA
jgi:hypothetical protein